MVTYHYHRMDVINFDCSLTAFRKPRLAEKVKAYFLHLKPETTRGKFSYQETNLSSRSAGMQKTLQSRLFLLQPTSHLQHPDVELLTLHIQLLLYFSKTSQFLLGCYDIRIAVYNNLHKGGDILCSKADIAVVLAQVTNLLQDFQ